MLASSRGVVGLPCVCMIAWARPYVKPQFQLFFKNIFPAFFPAFYFQKNCILIVALCLPEMAWWRAFAVFSVYLVY